MFKVTFRGKITAEIDVERELSLLAAAGQLPLAHRCGGHARCGTCLVTVEEGQERLSEKESIEARILRILKARQNQRLACQARIRGDVCCRVD